MNEGKRCSSNEWEFHTTCILVRRVQMCIVQICEVRTAGNFVFVIALGYVVRRGVCISES